MMKDCPSCEEARIGKLCEELTSKYEEKVIEIQSNKHNMRKYHREIKDDVWVDVYDVLEAFEVTNPATAHALKKLLAAGKRGYKNHIDDLKEAIVSLNRAIEIEESKCP